MSARVLICSLGALLLLAGCGRDEVTSYRVPKEADPVLPVAATGAAAEGAPGPMAGGMPAMDGTSPGGGAMAGGAMSGNAAVGGAPAGATMANTAVPTAAGSLVWSAPAAWHVKAASAMRKGSYAVSGPGGADADLSITAFPGDVGGDLANVNRWRGQLQLPPLAAGALEAALNRFQTHGLTVAVVDLTGAGGANPQRILGAIVPVDGSTWFFKLMGPASVVAAAKPDFLEFLKSVRAP
jgi:hypothetical protein